MKTFRIFSMVIMALITVFFIVVAQIQRGYAEEAVAEVIKQAELVEEQKREAEKRTAEAIQAQNLADQYRIRLENCEGSGK